MQDSKIRQAIVEPIGMVRSGFKEKFGTPRQAGLVNAAVSTLELLPPFNRPEMVKGLAEFSHIWLQFLFHETFREGWKATVRPPRLGGAERLGVFATRSPHRPNHVGLSAVRLLRIIATGGSVSLEIGGADLLDGTPVLDIKPYLLDRDCIPEASRGWLPEESRSLWVEFSSEAAGFCKEYEKKYNYRLQDLIRETLELDPRPGSQRGRKHQFGMRLYDVNIRWEVEGTRCRVLSCTIIEQA
jgi:tRNA-Thr(GGU) m(6)t(6)A37 methyltransferase TsaA